MIEKYYKFQVDRFFEDYRENQKKLARLKDEREAELTSFSMDYSTERVTNSNISDPTEQRAFKRALLEEKIKDLESYFVTHEYDELCIALTKSFNAFTLSKLFKFYRKKYDAIKNNTSFGTKKDEDEFFKTYNKPFKIY